MADKQAVQATTRRPHVLRRLRSRVEQLQQHREMGAYDIEGRYIMVTEMAWWIGLSRRDRARVLKEANRYG